MLVTAPRMSPRWKEWIPLFTQQLRLRNLIQVFIFNIKSDIDEENERSPMRVSIYYTLHLTEMSAPFYTSEKIESVHSKWNEIDVNDFDSSVCGAESGVILRLWSSRSQDQTIGMWGIHFNGLEYLGPSLNLEFCKFKSNVLVLLFPGGYFIDPNSIEDAKKIRFVYKSINTCDVRQSYTCSLLTRLHNLQQVIVKHSKAAESLKQKISKGGFVEIESRPSTLLKKLMSKSKPKTERQDLILMRKKIEIAKFRIECLRENHDRHLITVNNLKRKLERLYYENQVKESTIMSNYCLLNKEVESYKEWRQGHIEKRELQLHSRAMWNFRSNQLISELACIYPITEANGRKYLICGVHLPNSEDFSGQDETQLSVALGYVAHVLQVISVFLQVPLRYPVIHLGSRSLIMDQISHGLIEKEFPLYLQGKDKILFDYAVYLLNKNIAQLRWYFGYPTSDLRFTLYNLSSLIQPKLSPQISKKQYTASNLHIYESASPTFSNFSSSTHLELPKEFESGVSLSPEHRSPGLREYLMKYKEKNVSNLNSSLSYSLDKGLNKYEEIKKCVKSDNNFELPENKLKTHVGSEPFLVVTSTSTNNKDMTIQSKVLEDKSKETVPQEKVKSEIIESNICDENDDKTFLASSSSGDNIDAIKTELHQVECYPSPVNLENSSKNSTQLSSCEILEVKDTQSDHPNTNSPITTTINDNNDLLANVASRTQALVSQPTTFNMFRSRFGSTLDSS